MYQKLEDGSYVVNCFIKPRYKYNKNATALFSRDGDKTIRAHLNGYAIVPVEEYLELTGKDMGNRDRVADIKQAEIDLGEVDVGECACGDHQGGPCAHCMEIKHGL